MNRIAIGIVFFIALFACLVILMTFARKKLVDQPLEAARSRNAPVADFVDDLQRHWWVAVIGIAILVAVDKHFGLSHGALQSKLVLAAVVTAIFGARMLTRRSAQPTPQPGTAVDSNPPRQER